MGIFRRNFDLITLQVPNFLKMKIQGFIILSRINYQEVWVFILSFSLFFEETIKIYYYYFGFRQNPHPKFQKSLLFMASFFGMGKLHI